MRTSLFRQGSRLRRLLHPLRKIAVYGYYQAKEAKEAWLRKRRNTDMAAYRAWLQRSRPSKNELAYQKQTSEQFAYRPLISIITPVYNPPPKVLRDTIRSVRAQTYPHWELCLADGNSQ